MKLCELEVKNYKCLDNIGMPLKFGNLNLFIGENDSGKTSLLELIRIVFNDFEVKKEVFFDPSEEIIIKAKFKDVNRKILEQIFAFEHYKITNYDYFRDIGYVNNKLTLTSYDFEEIITYFSNIWENINLLKDFAFYNKIVRFFKTYLNKIFLKAIYKFSLVGPKIINSPKVEVKSTDHLDEISIMDENNEEDYKITKKANIYFDFDEEVRKYIVEELLISNEFLDFMQNYTRKYNDICEGILEDIYQSSESEILKFSLNNVFYNKELVYQKDGTIDEDCYNEFLEIIKRGYGSTVFQDDDKEKVLSKIANALSVVISNKNCDLKIWNPNCCLNDIIDTPDCPEGDLVGQNIIGNITVDYLPNYSNIPKPEIYVFNTEVINEKIPEEILFKLFFENKEQFHEFAFDHLKAFFLDIVKRQRLYESFFKREFKEYDNFRKKIIEYMNMFGEKLDDLDFDIYFKNIEEIKKYLIPEFKLRIRENKKDIDIVQKGQGFLRKLLISDFLILVEDVASSNTDTIKIILIEEPEIHLHSSAQKMLIDKLKSALGKSNNQVFITTHSHFLMENVNFDDIFVFKKNKEINKSIISNTRQFGSSIEILNDLQNSLGIAKSDIFNILKLIIFVEGKRDKIFLESLAKRPEINLNLEKVKIIQVDGQDKMDYYVKSDLFNEFLDLELMVILDKNKKNEKRRKNLVYNKKIKPENIILIDEPDILDYLSNRDVEKYYNLKKNSIGKNDKKLEHLLEHDYNIKIKDEDIEHLVISAKNINESLLEILKKIKSLL